MDITRQVLKHTYWQTQGGKQILITDMDDKHLDNSINMLERQNLTGSYGHELLIAERQFRQEAPEATEATEATQLDLFAPPLASAPNLRIKAAGTTAKGLGEVTRALDAIGEKHHGCLWEELDDIESYGYDGDGW